MLNLSLSYVHGKISLDSCSDSLTSFSIRSITFFSFCCQHGILEICLFTEAADKYYQIPLISRQHQKEVSQQEDLLMTAIQAFLSRVPGQLQ